MNNKLEITKSEKERQNEFMMELIKKEEYQELMWIAQIKVWPCKVSQGIPENESIINEEIFFNMKQMNRVKSAFDNLMKEVIRAKIENNNVSTNELANMAKYPVIRESEEFDEELARKVSAILRKRMEEKKLIKSKDKKSILKRLIGYK